MIINEKEYELKFTGLTLVIYKEQFHKDFLNTITNLGALSEDYTTILEITWAMLRTCDAQTPTYLEWCNTITDITEIISTKGINEIISIVNNDVKQTKNLKKKVTQNLK